MKKINKVKKGEILKCEKKGRKGKNEEDRKKKNESRNNVK